jgi:hypothetical protein
MLGVLVIVIAGVWTAGMTSESCALALGPDGGVPIAVPVFEMNPRFTSACVVVYVAVHVVDAPGASVVTGHVTAESPGSGSVTCTAVRF